MNPGATLNALVLVANGSEDIESVTAIDVLRRAKINVTVASVDASGGKVQLAQGTNLVPDASLENLGSQLHQQYSAVVLPGGLKGAHTFADSKTVQLLLREFEQHHRVIAAMCAAPIALKAAGVGKGMTATSYPSFEKDLQQYFNYVNQPVVTDGNLITSRAPGTAMSWALHIVAKLLGDDNAKQIASHLYHPYP